VNDPRGVVEAVERALDRGGDADDVLREIVTILHERGRYPWAAITFVEEGREVEGPQAGAPEAGASFPISFQGQLVAHLHVAGAADADRELLEKVAGIVSPYALVGWDTGGEEWVP
jgi:hypothetical protein